MPVVVAIGAYFGLVITPLLIICAIVVVIILVALNKISNWEVYLYLVGISLGLIWQTTMLGVDVVGSDIHVEYYFAQFNTLHPWDVSKLDSSNTSIVIGLIAPWISTLFHIDMIWVFKIILPMFLACVPLVLFAAFKKMFGDKRAFFATIFFMIIPMFSIESAQIAKTMVAELFFALMVYCIVSDWKWGYKLVGISSFLIMQILTHYTIGVLGICFLLGVLIFRIVTKPIRWKFLLNTKVPILVLALCLLISAGTFYKYYSYAGTGTQLRALQWIASDYLPDIVNAPPLATETPIENKPIVIQETPINSNSSVPNTKAPGIQVPISHSSTEPVISQSLIERLSTNPTMVKIGIGLDFFEVPLSGKIFRVIQLLTELLMIIGVGRLVFVYKRYNSTTEFIGLVGSSGILLIVCILVVGFSSVINMSRFFHISLFFLSPMFILGIEQVCSWVKLDNYI